MDENSRIKQWLAACVVASLMAVTLPFIAHAAPASHGGEGKGEILPVAPDFFPMPGLNIPLLKKNRKVGALMVEMVLDVASDETMQEIAVSRTRLRAGYVGALGKWVVSFQDARAPANVIAIKNQLQTVTNEVLGRNDAIVLLQSAMINR